MRIFRLAPGIAITALLTTAIFAPTAFARDIDAVSFRDADTGFISGGYVDSQTRIGFASVTRDGGDTWTAVKIPSTRIKAIAATPSGAYAGSDYFDWVLGYTDAAGAWSPTSSGAVASNLSVFGITRLQNGRLVAVGMREPNSNKYAFITSSTNGGSTWTTGFEGPKYPPPDVYSDPPSTNAALVGIDESPDGGAVWAIGNEWQQGTSSYVYKQRLAFRSTDGGANWSLLTVPAFTNHKPVSTISALTSQTALAFGGARQYLKTTDGGATWAQLSLPTTTSVVVEMLASDSHGDRIVAVGINGMTARSLDGGTTWEYTRVSGVGTLRGVSMLTDTEWLAVGANETILKTTDSGATWTGQKAAIGPSTSITSPSSGFTLSPMKMTIGGLAADTGVGVTGVEILIKRSDGKSFNGATWTANDAWLPTQTSTSWQSWTTSWTPDAETIELGLMVTISARATDALGTTVASGGVTSGLPFVGSVSVAGGALYATATSVQASVSGPGANRMRWKIDNGTYTAWTAYSTTTTVTLTPGDGTKRVTFDFSADMGATSLGTAYDDIVLHTSVPAVAIVAPVSGSGLSESTVTVTGTSSDVGGTVSAVSVLIRRADGRSWTGSSWSAGDTWLVASSANSYASWSLAWKPDSGVVASGGIVSVSARAVDAAGLSATSAAVSLLAPAAASVTLNDGAATTTSVNVVATVAASSTPVPNRMRWRVEPDGFGAPLVYTGPTTVPVTLTSGDGTKTVTFEFSADGGSSWPITGSDTIVLAVPVQPPSVSLGAPMAGFPLVAGTTIISGSASDPAHAVDRVEVRIRRADGKTWDGVAWASSENWLPAGTSNGYVTWSYAWQPSLAQVGGGIVTVTARAQNTRGVSASSGSVSSAAPVTASISLKGGEGYINTAEVPVGIAASGATHMRWREGSGSPGSWQSYSTTAVVQVTSGDGSKTVTFELSADGANVSAAASDSIVLDATPPTASHGAPAFTSSRTVISVTATDPAGSGVAQVEYRVDGVDQLPLAGGAASISLSEPGAHVLEYRALDVAGNHSDWQTLDVDVKTTTTITLSAPSTSEYRSARLAGRLYDVAGQTLQNMPVVLEASSDGVTWKAFATTYTSKSDSKGWLYEFTAKPSQKTYYRAVFAGDAINLDAKSVSATVVPKVYLARPSFGRTTLSYGSTYSARGDLKPRHSSGSTQVKVLAYRYESGAYRYKKTYTAKAYNYSSYSRYVASIKLPSRGKWRLRALHAADSLNAKTYSSYRYVTVQ